MKQLYQPRRIHFLTAFVLIVIALAITKCVNPQLALPRLLSENDSIKNEPKHVPDSIELQAKRVDGIFLKERNRLTLLKKDGSPVKNRVTSVPRFETSFPDLNDVQLATASRLGIPMIENRDEAHHRMKDLVYIADNPFYTVQRLHQSIPYLVPRAATLLNQIARAFNDSLATKGYPLISYLSPLYYVPKLMYRNCGALTPMLPKIRVINMVLLSIFRTIAFSKSNLTARATFVG